MLYVYCWKNNVICTQKHRNLCCDIVPSRFTSASLDCAGFVFGTMGYVEEFYNCHKHTAVCFLSHPPPLKMRDCVQSPPFDRKSQVEYLLITLNP